MFINEIHVSGWFLTVKKYQHFYFCDFNCIEIICKHLTATSASIMLGLLESRVSASSSDNLIALDRFFGFSNERVPRLDRLTS